MARADGDILSWKAKSYDQVPALNVRGRHLRRSLRLVTLAWMLGVVWLACASGSQVKIFATMLGFNDFYFGLMSAVQFAATFGQLLASLLIERTGLVKYQFIHCGAVHRLAWLLVAAAPLVLPTPSGWAVAGVLTILAMSSFLAALSSPPWITWMGCLIPRRIRGRYFAYRERLVILVQTVVVIGVGLLMDVVYDPGVKGVQPRALWTICGVFAIGALFGTADILLFYRVPEVLPRASDGRKAPRDDLEADLAPTTARGLAGALASCGWLRLLYRMLLAPLKDRVFRHYVLFGTTITFSANLSGWYFWLNAMDNLGFSSLATNSLFMVVGPLSGLAAAGALGRAIDRWGRRPILILSAMGATLSLLPWLLAMRDTPCPGWLAPAVGRAADALARLLGPGWSVRVGPQSPLGAYLLAALGCLIGGASWTGIGLAQTGIVLGFSDGSGQSRYVAASSVFISVGGMLGGVVGGIVTQSLVCLRQAPIHVGPLLWNNWHVVFILSVAIRLLSISWLVGMPDPGAATVRAIVRYVGENVFNNLVSGLFYPLRIFGWRPDRPSADGHRHGEDTGNR